MSTALDFHSQIASIMEVLANAAVAEICKVVDDGYAVVHLEMSQSQKENEFLRRKIKLLELQIARYRAERVKGPEGSFNSRFPGVRLLNRQHRDALAGPSLQGRTRFLNRGPGAHQSLLKAQPINLDQDPNQEVVTTTKTESAEPEEEEEGELLIVKVEGAVEAGDSDQEAAAEARTSTGGGGGDGVTSPPGGPKDFGDARPAGRHSETEGQRSLKNTSSPQSKEENLDELQDDPTAAAARLPEEPGPPPTPREWPGGSETDGAERPSCSAYPPGTLPPLPSGFPAVPGTPRADGGDREGPASKFDVIVIDPLPDDGRGGALSWVRGGEDAMPLGSRGNANARSRFQPLPCIQVTGRQNPNGDLVFDGNGAYNNRLPAFKNPPVAMGTSDTQQQQQQQQTPPLWSGMQPMPDAPLLPRLGANHPPPSLDQNHNPLPSTSQDQESGPVDPQSQPCLPYACAFCARRYAHLCQLRIHERVHTGEKPYQCAQCGKSFGQFCSLKRHQMVHTGERPYRCAQCGKRFSTSNNLKVHQSVHTGEKRFHCSQCGKNFSFLSNLIRHQAIHAAK
ncbi:uncharacterized protein [Centroberyx affinis]|uniref:uncharacterized protein n=1 Tax=Centroberyx affinis TaxID=166261 RepID=UPI003A5BE7F0